MYEASMGRHDTMFYIYLDSFAGRRSLVVGGGHGSRVNVDR